MTETQENILRRVVFISNIRHTATTMVFLFYLVAHTIFIIEYKWMIIFSLFYVLHLKPLLYLHMVNKRIKHAGEEELWKMGGNIIEYNKIMYSFVCKMCIPYIICAPIISGIIGLFCSIFLAFIIIVVCGYPSNMRLDPTFELFEKILAKEKEVA